MSVVSWLILILVLAAVAIAVFAAFYQRATSEVSLVRTGTGRGRNVAINGGLLAIPWFHEVSRVNMLTLRLEVRRGGSDALITKDRLRVDVAVEFYVSVDPTVEAIARAAQTLGERTFDAERLRDLLEGKLVDTLSAVAAQMTMDDLHEKRGEFVAEVSRLVGESLRQNGVALESASLTRMDQTPFSDLDENNAFNAVGMRKLAAVIADSKKERAQIDRESEVAVHRSAMEATKRKLEIDLEEQSAQLRQSQELESRRAAQIAEIAEHKAQSERAAKTARIQMEQDIRAADIAREQTIKEAQINQAQAIEIAEQERAITIAAKTEAESQALAAADLARAEATKAAEAIATARALAEAHRRKEVALVAAQQESAVNNERIVSEAQAQVDAAEARYKATINRARAEAEAAEFQIATQEKETAAKARGQLALNEAENVLREEIIALKSELARLEALPAILEQMVKPAEKIDSIRVHHISGDGFKTREGDAPGAPRSPVNHAIDSIMEMAVQLPALKRIGEELGIDIDRAVTRDDDEER